MGFKEAKPRESNDSESPKTEQISLLWRILAMSMVSLQMMPFHAISELVEKTVILYIFQRSKIRWDSF